MYFLPASAVLYSALAEIWGLPYPKEVNATITAVILFISTLIGISTQEYERKLKEEIEDIKKQEKPPKAFETLPSLEDPYFVMGDREGTRKGCTGYSPCIAGRVQVAKGSTLNNCVGATWGLFAKFENNPKCKVGHIKTNMYPQDGGSWWNDGKSSAFDKYPRGQEPQLASVICFSNHVAFVNEIKENGDLEIISSSLGSTNPNGFEIETLTKSSGYARNGMKPLGYIYH